MSSTRILIVEDEILIADMLERYLNARNYTTIGKAISYEEAIEMYDQTQPDLVLLDIRLNSERSGIDVARYIQKHANPRPFIFLTSQLDSHSLNAAKETYPGGYLPKPINKQTLFTTIEMALYRGQANQEVKSISIFDGTNSHSIGLDEVLFLQSDHVYTKIYVENTKRPLIQRASIKELIEQLPSHRFVQTHRSYVVNTSHISQWNTDHLFVGEHLIPISRYRKKDVLKLLTKK